jgi:thiol-disulfide isomerase/thioredoxin
VRDIDMSAIVRLLVIAFLVGVLAAPTSPVLAQETRIGIERGSVPDSFVLTDVRGGEVDLGESLGHGPVLLEFWATWCENCEALHPRMLEAHERFGDRVAFFAIAVAVGQSERRVRGHLDRHPVPYPTLWDGRGEAVRAFETPATSYVVIVDAAGKVAYTGLGRDQDIDAAIRAVLSSGTTD